MLHDISALIRQKGQVTLPSTSESFQAYKLNKEIQTVKNSSSVVIVYHKESQSFSESKTELIENNLKILAKRYPAYVSKTDLWLKNFPLKNTCLSVKYLINQYERKNILFVVK